jgi:molybdate transport system substrate-binding protein
MTSKKLIPILLCAVVSVLIITCGCAAPTQTAQGKQLTVFAAASLTDAFTEIGQNYHTNHSDTKVTFNFDGSQILQTQIENGAYADIFASASNTQMNALKSQGLMNNSTVNVFAQNKLVVIIPKSNPANITTLADLAKPGVKIVIGTQSVPVGNYTLQVLDKMANDTAYGPDYKNRVLANVVSQEPNVNNVVTKVALGEADAGFVYQSDVPLKQKDQVDKIVIPDKYNVIAQYPIGILKQSKDRALAQDFINYVNSPAGQAVLQKYGFIIPQGLTSQSATTVGVTSQRMTAMA